MNLNPLNAITSISRFFKMNQMNGQGKAEQLPYDPRDENFHRLMDKLMRFPKVALLFCAMGVLIWPIFDAPGFTTWATAINTLSDNAWTAIILIIASWATNSFVRSVKTPVPTYTATMGSISSAPPTTNSNGPRGRLNNTVEDNSHLVDGDSSSNPALSSWKNKKS